MGIIASHLDLTSGWRGHQAELGQESQWPLPGLLESLGIEKNEINKSNRRGWMYNRSRPMAKRKSL